MALSSAPAPASPRRRSVSYSQNLPKHECERVIPLTYGAGPGFSKAIFAIIPPRMLEEPVQGSRSREVLSACWTVLKILPLGKPRKSKRAKPSRVTQSSKGTRVAARAANELASKQRKPKLSPYCVLHSEPRPGLRAQLVVSQIQLQLLELRQPAQGFRQRGRALGASGGGAAGAEVTCRKKWASGHGYLESFNASARR